jgi:hypothetical protein
MVKQKIELERFLENLYLKKDEEQFEYIKEINPHFSTYAKPGDMLIIMNKPPRNQQLSAEAKKDLEAAQKDAQKVADIRKTLPATSETAETEPALAAIDTSCLDLDNHATVCTNQRYGSFDAIKSSSQSKVPTQQDVMNFFQPILEKGCTDDPTNCATTGIGAYLAASDKTGDNAKGMEQMKSLLDELNDLMKDHAKKMNVHTSKAVKNTQRQVFLEKKRALLKELKSKINKNMMRAIDLPVDGKLKTNLGLSTKANIYQARGNKTIVGVKGGYASRYAYVAKISKLLKTGGYIAAAVGTTQTMYKAYSICSIEPDSAVAKQHNLSQSDLDDACEYQTGQSIAKSAGLVAGGMGGGVAGTYVVCNIAFGLETFGTSLFWCALVAGGVSAAAGSYYGAEWMSGLLDYTEGKLGNEIYLRGKISAAKISGEETLYQ